MDSCEYSGLGKISYQFITCVRFCLLTYLDRDSWGSVMDRQDGLLDAYHTIMDLIMVPRTMENRLGRSCRCTFPELPTYLT